LEIEGNEMKLATQKNDTDSSYRVLMTNIDDFAEIAKALSSDLRVAMFKRLLKGQMNVAEIAELFEIPASTAAVNIKKLEDVGLIRTELIPGTRGTQKVCAAVYSRIIVDTVVEPENQENFVVMQMPIGHFFDCNVTPSCGILSDSSIIGEIDDPSAFFEPDRMSAQLIWFRKGYLEYRFPNRAPHGTWIKNLELTMELCSEAPLTNADWPSDISLWINGAEVGMWTCPGDFGGERGLLTPHWWGTENTQFGVLKTWRINEHGTFIDGRQISNVKISDVQVDSNPYIVVRICVKPDAVNDGGINLFGRKFGNYETDLAMRLDYVSRKA
jgi:predicted transcriptional regulator